MKITLEPGNIFAVRLVCSGKKWAKLDSLFENDGCARLYAKSRITLCLYIAGVPCLQLESQLRQLRLRAESEAADVSQLKSDLEAAQVERLSLQKRIGLLSRKNEDLARENGMEVCDGRGIHISAIYQVSRFFTNIYHTWYIYITSDRFQK